MLGGDIVVHSALGEGSAFTASFPVSLPATPAQPAESQSRTMLPAPGVATRTSVPAAREASSTMPLSGGIEDDRARLTPHSRVILVVEDDVRFAAILRDLAH